MTEKTSAQRKRDQRTREKLARDGAPMRYCKICRTTTAINQGAPQDGYHYCKGCGTCYEWADKQ